MWGHDYGAFSVVVLLASCAGLSLEPVDLSGKRIVAFQRGFVDWETPQHGAYGQASAGQFGILPRLVESLGGGFDLSSDLSEADLDRADVVLMLHPVDDLSAAQHDRLWQFVRNGGALLVVGEPFYWDGARASGSNRVLEPTSIRVARSVAISETGNWEQACLFLAHPATRGGNTRAGQDFSDGGAPLRIGARSRPLVIGRWGWSDHGSDAVLTGNYRFEPGEQLGDLVLAAQQKVGKGMVVVLGDDAGLTNEGLVRGYAWSGRLLSFLAGSGRNPLSGWRPWGSLLLVCLLLILVAWQRPACLVQVSLLLALSLSVCEQLASHASPVLPDGRLLRSDEDPRPNKMAYIDASHMGAFSDADWGFNSINGLSLALMRDGYLTVNLPELRREHLARAGVLVSIAPARSFTPDEIQWLCEYVSAGGILICMVGAEQAPASQPLLSEFHLRVPASPVPTGGGWREPEPMGRFRSLYLDARDYNAGDYKAGVLFHSGWPVRPESEDAEVLVYGENDQPIVVTRRVGRGSIVVIGDSEFALNKNLEYVTGDAFEGRYENADFWRWLLSRITNRSEWVPPLETSGHPLGEQEPPEGAS